MQTLPFIKYAAIVVLVFQTVGCVNRNKTPSETQAKELVVQSGSEQSQTKEYELLVDEAENFIRMSVYRYVLEQQGDANARSLQELIDHVSVNCQLRLSLRLREDLLRSDRDYIPVAVDFWVERKGQLPDDISQLGSISINSLHVPDNHAADRILRKDSDIEYAMSRVHSALRSLLREVMRESPKCAGSDKQ